MEAFWDLLADVDTVGGRLVTSAVIVLGALALGVLLGSLLARTREDPTERYYTRKITRYVAAFLALIALAIVWRAFAGRIGVVLGLLAAGLAFAMQEVIGALAGWFSITFGRIFRVGDRVQMAGVQGDVIDISPMRTKVMEIGSGREDAKTWVRGRQFTGRVVAISNKAVFTEPVFNYSAIFEFIWEELTLPVAYHGDWRAAERMLMEEVRATWDTEDAQRAIREMRRRYPVGRAEVEPRVFARATDDYLELSARFVVPVRSARASKDELTRRVLTRLEDAGIEIASTTQDVTIRRAED